MKTWFESFSDVGLTGYLWKSQKRRLELFGRERGPLILALRPSQIMIAQRTWSIDSGIETLALAEFDCAANVVH